MWKLRSLKQILAGENCVQMLCVTSQYGNHGRDCGYGKKGWGLRISRWGSWRHSGANRHQTRRINRRWLDGDGCFQTTARQWGRRHRKSSARKQIDARQSDRRGLIIQDCFSLLLQHGLFGDTRTKTKANGGKRMSVPCRNIFRETKKQKSQKLHCISIKLHQVCLRLQPPLLPSPLLLTLIQQDQPLFYLFNVKTRMKSFMMIDFHLMNSKYIFSSWFS